MALNLADAKGFGAAVAELGTAIIFGSGQKDGGTMPFVVETPKGRVMLAVFCPPEWASERLLLAASARASCFTLGSCMLCGAVGSTAPGLGYEGFDEGFHERFEHEDGCDVMDDNLTTLYRAERAEHDRRPPSPASTITGTQPTMSLRLGSEVQALLWSTMTFSEWRRSLDADERERIKTLTRAYTNLVVLAVANDINDDAKLAPFAARTEDLLLWLCFEVQGGEL